MCRRLAMLRFATLTLCLLGSACSDAVPGRAPHEGGGGAGGEGGARPTGPSFADATRAEISVTQPVRLGLSLDLEGSTLAAGARSATDTTAWSVFVFARDGTDWVEQAELEPRHVGRFGESLALDGDVLAVAEPSLPPDVGFAHLYLRGGTTWSFNGSVSDPGQPISDFGTAIAVDQGQLAIGAGRPIILPAVPGQACFIGFRNDMSPVDPPACQGDLGPGLGCSAALDGNTAVLGACGKAHGAAGGAHVFGRGTDDWAYLGQLGDGPLGDGFGRAVALDDETALVAGEGVVLVFTRSGGVWTRAAELRPDDAGGDFGRDVGLSGDRAIVGAPQADAGAGAAYVFARTGETWRQQTKLQPTGNHREFGYAVAIDGSVAAVSAPGDDARITVFTAP